MSMKVKIRKIGSSAGVILPKAELDRLDVKVGDELAMDPVPYGLVLDAEDAGRERRMLAFEGARQRYDGLLQALADK